MDWGRTKWGWGELGERVAFKSSCSDCCMSFMSTDMTAALVYMYVLVIVIIFPLRSLS